jgi:glycosyltransferase involved in cell wall biosynthesis
MASPIVSVILCNYNYGRFLGQAIRSVLSQTYADLELIIVDDASTDDSRQVIASYQGDPRVRAIYHEENRGQAAAFNTGFANSEGSLVAFLDSDDTWKPEKLAKMREAFEDGAFSVVQHNLEVIDSHSRPVGQVHPGLDPGIIDVLREYFAQNHTGFFSSTSGLACRRSHLERIFPLDENWRICAEVAFTRPLPIYGRVCTLKEPLGYYRIHGTNCWMNTDRQRQLLENEQRYVDYTNQWLARVGCTERIEFTKSALYRDWALQFLPRLHPLRVWKTVRVTAVTILPHPALALLRLVKRTLQSV